MKFIIVITQFQAAMATNCWVLICYKYVSYVVCHKQVSSLLFQFSMSVLWILVISLYRYVKYSALYKGDGLQFIIYVCYSWEVALNTGLNLSFDNM
jgi:hypothetical protein